MLNLKVFQVFEMNGPKIDILLATYQGSSYIDEQISSIIEQSYQNFHLWIRDDNSSDQTGQLLNQWALAYPQKITLILSDKNLGITQNFSCLLDYAQAPYVCFADQDDKWLPHKLEWSLKKMQELEKKHGHATPLLIHSDLVVASKDLSIIHPSFWKYTRLNPHLTSLNRLLIQNNVTGCTLIINRSLVDLAKPIPENVAMHDWWLALVASCFGVIGNIEQPTLLYRQHVSNDTGAKQNSVLNYFIQNSKEKNKKEDAALFSYHHAEMMLERYKLLLSEKNRNILQSYAKLRTLPYVKQKLQTLKYQFYKQGFLRFLKTFLCQY
ncbi:Uncharacterized protein PRO82_000103 [Candidatus Protochlamydia amoebophila]|nr:Uncharacterized protein [Candidatus Protochlamydia amoebophila]